MTSKERVLNAIRFKNVDYIPVNTKKDPMGPALIGRKIEPDFYLDGEAMAKAELALLEEIPDDFTGIMVRNAVQISLGANMYWPGDDHPQNGEPAIHNLEEAKAIQIPDPYKNEWLKATIDCLRILREKLGEDRLIECCSDGVFNIAASLCGTDYLMKYFLTNRELVNTVCDKIIEFFKVYGAALHENGLDIFYTGDATSSPSCISPALYKEVALDYHKAWIKNAKDEGMLTNYHPCGGEYPIIDYVGQTGADILWFSDLVDLRVSQQIFYHRYCVAGDVNATELLFMGDAQSIDEYIKELLSGLKHKSGAIIQPGCALSPNIPVENLRALVESVRRHSHLAGASLE